MNSCHQEAVARQSIVTAVSLLQQASAADAEGNAELASKIYTEVCTRLEGQLPYLPPEHQELTAKHLHSIKQRIQVIRDEKLRPSAASDYPKFVVAFKEHPTPVEDTRDVLPPSTILRPFWLMRLISKSMQSGAYVVPGIYVSKAVWTQDGALSTVTVIPQKVKYLGSLCEALEPMQAVSASDEKKFIQALDNFLQLANSLRVQYVADVGAAKANLSTVAVPHRSKLELGFRELLNKGKNLLSNWKIQQNATYSEYLAWAVNALEQAQLFDRWITFFSTTTRGNVSVDVMDRLHRISAYFYFWPCRIVLQDMFFLLERYMSKARESLSRLLPVDIVLQAAQPVPIPAPAAAEQPAK